MNATIRKSGGGFFVVRSDGVQWLGATWPTGAVGSFARRKSASVFARDRVAVDDGYGIDDQIDRAREEVEGGRAKSVVVARAVGRFGDSTLYERAYDVLGEEGTAPDFFEVAKHVGDRETKTVHLQITKAAKARRIEGLASTPNIDRDYDVVEPTAFAEFMPKFMQNPVMLWMHDVRRPAGKVVEFEVRENGLWIAGEITDDEVWRWIDTETVRALSASFIVLDRKIENVGGSGEPGKPGITVRRITKAELLEVSVVTIPANRESLFAVAKSLSSGDDLVCRGCSCSGTTCECAEARVVVEHRPFKAAGSGPVDMRREAIAERGGREADRVAKLLDLKDAPTLRHHGVQDGDLVTSIEAVRAGLAYLACYADASSGRPLTEAERAAAWKHLGAHLADAGMELPEAPKGPAPERAAALLGASERGDWSVMFSSSKFADEEACVEWLRKHGFPKEVAAKGRPNGWRRFAAGGGDEELEAHPLEDGVRAVLYRRAMKEPMTAVTAKSDAQGGAAKPPDAPAAPAAAADPTKVEPAPDPGANKAAPATGAELVEVDSEDLSILEHADDADPGDLQRAIENVFQSDD